RPQPTAWNCAGDRPGRQAAESGNRPAPRPAALRTAGTARRPETSGGRRPGIARRPAGPVSPETAPTTASRRRPQPEPPRGCPGPGGARSHGTRRSGPQPPPHTRKRLEGATSPYSQQHKDNPVDCYPWGDEAFARANAEATPILLAAGYAACHLCD